MYIGETTDAPPTPSPPTRRKRRKDHQLPGERAAYGGDEVEHGDREKHKATAESVGRASHRHRAEDRPDERARDGEAETEARQAEDGLERFRRPRDDRGVEAEEQPAQCGDKRAAEQIRIEGWLKCSRSSRAKLWGCVHERR